MGLAGGRFFFKYNMNLLKGGLCLIVILMMLDAIRAFPASSSGDDYPGVEKDDDYSDEGGENGSGNDGGPDAEAVKGGEADEEYTDDYPDEGNPSKDGAEPKPPIADAVKEAHGDFSAKLQKILGNDDGGNADSPPDADAVKG